MKTIEIKEKCQSCKGTGLYVGMAEHDGAAVVCSACKGTGCFEFRHMYEDFVAREKHPTAVRVYECNPGVGIGQRGGLRLEDFGGMPVSDWEAGAQFPAGSEMRRYVCPAWWAQSSGKTPRTGLHWCPEQFGCRFSYCVNFCNKHECWKRFDNGVPK